jgi:hypothetical protein
MRRHDALTRQRVAEYLAEMGSTNAAQRYSAAAHTCAAKSSERNVGRNYGRAMRHNVRFADGVPNGIRTRVFTVKG